MLPPVDAFAGISVSLDLSTHVGQLTLARPAKGNAIDEAMWSELGPGVRWLVEAGARAVSEGGASVSTRKLAACRPCHLLTELCLAFPLSRSW